MAILRGPAHKRARRARHRRKRQDNNRRRKATMTRPVVLKNPRPERILTTLIFNSGTKTMVASDTYTLSTLAQYRVNGAYDPDVAVGGGSCRNFNFLASMYKRYRVHKAICTAYVSQVPSGARPCTVYITPHVSTYSIGIDSPNIREMAETRLAVLKADGTQAQVSSAANPAALFGVTKKQINSDDAFSAASSSTPGLQGYWSIRVVKKDSVAAANVNTYLNVKIKYWVEFYQPQEDEL